MKNNFIIKIKRNLISMLIILFIFFLVLYSDDNMQAVKSGLNLWINSVIPTLFPFFIATELLCNTNFINILGRLLEKPISKIFNVPGEGVFALLMGTISGYPSGAKIVAKLKSEKILNNEQAERLISFTNNSGPLFILGTIGISLINNKMIGYILLISHLISCILVGIIFKNWKNNGSVSMNIKIKENYRNLNIRNFGEILNESLKNSISSIINIGGFIIFFSVLISILYSSGFFTLTGIIFEKVNISKEIRKFNY